MPPLIIANTWRVALTWQWLNAGTNMNVLHVSPAVIGTTLTQIAADNIKTCITSAFASSTYDSFVSNGYTLDYVTVTDLRTVGAPEYTSDANATGLDSVNALPANVALVTTLRTALRGRSYRGRCYLGGWTETANGYSAPSPAAVAGADSFFVDLRASLTLNGTPLVIGSPTLGISTAVTSSQTNSRWDTQRRRINAFG